MRNIHVELYEIWTCRFKIFLIWSSGGPFVPWSQTICAKGEGIKCFGRRCLLNIFLIWSSGSHFVLQSEIISAILVEDIMRYNSVNLFRIRASGSGGCVV